MPVLDAEEEFLAFDPYMDECEVKYRTVKMVTTRKEQTCFCPIGKVHSIPAGTRARFEAAMVEGEWGRYYTCVPCLEYGLSFDQDDPKGCKGAHEA